MGLSRFTAALLVLIVGSHTVFLSGGLLGITVELASKLCTCNHGAKQEKHSDGEDHSFRSKIKTSHSKRSNLAHCHDAKPGEVHVCSCKKSKSSLEQLARYHQSWIIASHRIIQNIVSEIIAFFRSEDQRLAEGWPTSLIKPPRIPFV